MLAVVTLFAIYVVGMPTLIVWTVHRPPRRVPRWLSWFGLDQALRWVQEAPTSALNQPVLFPQAGLLQLAILGLDAATLGAVVHSLGETVSVADTFTSFILATMAASISLLPGGIGSFEAGSVAALRLVGVPLEAAIAATILFRGFTLYLPLIPGSVLARREVKK